MGRSRGRGGGRESPGRGRHDGAHAPADPRLLQGNAAADEAGPGAGPRAASAVSRRALYRHRPGGPARPAGCDPRPGRDRAQRGGLQPRPARGRGADAEHHPAAPRPAGGRGPGAGNSRPDRPASRIGSCWSATITGRWRPSWSAGKTSRA